MLLGDGTRNSVLNRAAFNLGQVVAGGSLSEDTVRQRLTAAADAVGLEAGEIAATIKSGLEAGFAEPRRPNAKQPEFVDQYTRAREDHDQDLSQDALASDLGARSWDQNARHVALWGKWLFWSGTRWQVDDRLEHMTRTRLYLRTVGDTEPVGKDVIVGLIHQISVQGSHGKTFDEEAANFVLAFVDSMQPADAAEAVLLTQMAATHQAMMMMTRRLNRVQTLPQQESAERAVNKLGRTFATQMDTLKRYRSKGQQVVRVERVMVAEGGQAIVGNVETGGRGR